MKTPHSPNATKRKPRGFTLMEILVTATLSVMVIGAVLYFLVFSSSMARKTLFLNTSLNNSRLIADHITREITKARSFPTLINLNPGSTASSAITYRVAIGIPGTAAATSKDSSTIVINYSDNNKPQIGDYLLLGRPNLNDGQGSPIISVSESPSGVYTLTLPQSIADQTTGNVTDVNLGEPAIILRERRYAITTAADGTGQLEWYATTAAGATPVTLSSNLSTTTPFIFSKTGTTEEPRLAYSLLYQAAPSGVWGKLLPGKNTFYLNNSVGSELMNRSGDPISVNSDTINVSAAGSISASVVRSASVSASASTSLSASASLLSQSISTSTSQSIYLSASAYAVSVSQSASAASYWASRSAASASKSASIAADPVASASWSAFNASISESASRFYASFKASESQSASAVSASLSASASISASIAADPVASASQSASAASVSASAVSASRSASAASVSASAASVSASAASVSASASSYAVSVSQSASAASASASASRSASAAAANGLGGMDSI